MHFFSSIREDAGAGRALREAGYRPLLGMLRS